MPDIKDSQSTNSGIKTSADGTTYIPASKRADGSTRREIRVRPGYRPPEDVATYKNRSAEAWKNRGTGGVPGAEERVVVSASPETKSKNAKRREAAKKKAEEAASSGDQITTAMEKHSLSPQAVDESNDPENLAANPNPSVVADTEEVERQKKIRNHLKKLKAVQELKTKRAAGEKLSHDQLVKVGKESELRRDLKKLNIDGPEMPDHSSTSEALTNGTSGDSSLG